MKCVECTDYLKCSKEHDLRMFRRHCKKAKEEKVVTNADRIRAMTDEELAEWLARTQIANVAEALEIAGIPWEREAALKDEMLKEVLEWLQQPAEGDA